MSIHHYPSSHAAPVATPLVLDMRNYEAPMTVTARPGAGGTMLVEVSTSPNAIDTVAGLPAAAWQEWASGAVTEITSDTLLGPISAMRVTATVTDGRLEVVR